MYFFADLTSPFAATIWAIMKYVALLSGFIFRHCSKNFRASPPFPIIFSFTASTKSITVEDEYELKAAFIYRFTEYVEWGNILNDIA